MSANQQPQAGPENTIRHEPLWITIRRLPKPVWIIFVGMFINRFGTFVVPFLALHLTRIGYSVTESGFAVGAYGAGHLMASVAGGHFADSLGRKNTIIISMVSSALVMLCLSQINALWAFIPLAAVAGFAAELYRPAGSALISDSVGPMDRLVAFAGLRFAINLGWAIGPATAGLVVKYSYFWLFAGDAATSLAFGIIAWWGLERDKDEADRDWYKLNYAFLRIKETSIIALKDARFVRLTLSSFATALVFMQIFSTLGVDMKSRLFSEQTFGLLLAMNGVWIVLFEIPLTAFTRRFPSRKVIGVGYGFIGLSMFLLAMAKTVWGYAFAMTVFTLGEMISMPVTMAYAANLAPTDMRGRYLGVFGLTWASAMTIGPTIGLAVFDMDRAALWGGCAVLACWAGIHVSRRPHEAPWEQSPAPSRD